MSQQPDHVRRGILGGMMAAFTAAFAPTVANAAGTAAKTGPKVRRVFTKDDMKTTLEDENFENTLVRRGEATIIPAGCYRHLEGAALSVSINHTQPNVFSDYHNDPNQRHNLTFVVEGSCDIATKDGKKFNYKPGEWISVEDAVGEGHASWYLENGFLRLSLYLPSNDMRAL